MYLAAVRPDEWNLPLLLHVTGAMVLVGALVTVAAVLIASRRSNAAQLSRLGFRTLLAAALPAFILMRVGAEWAASEADVPEEAAWIVIGYIVSDAGLLLLIIATVLAGIGARRMSRGEPSRLPRATTTIALLMLGAYLVAIWAMTSKPA